jgi:hypothetical protein
LKTIPEVKLPFAKSWCDEMTARARLVPIFGPC